MCIVCSNNRCKLWEKCFLFLVTGSENEEEDDNEFYDALAEGGGTPNQVADDHFTLNIRTGTGHRRNSSDSSSETEETQTKQVSTKKILF